METFYPFIHEKKDKKKEQSEPMPLYIELVPPAPEKKESPSETEEPGVIVIELW
jgi:hypothetical protein